VSLYGCYVQGFYLGGSTVSSLGSSTVSSSEVHLSCGEVLCFSSLCVCMGALVFYGAFFVGTVVGTTTGRGRDVVGGGTVEAVETSKDSL